MFEIGGSLQELLGILVVTLLGVGPKRLREVGRTLARALRELRRAHDEFRSTLETNLRLDLVAPSAEPGAVEAPSLVATLEAPAARDCRWAAHVKVPEWLAFESAIDATARGLLPCPICQPSSG